MKKFFLKLAPYIIGIFLAYTPVFATVLFVPQGGTGVSTLTGILVGNGTSPVTTVTLPADATKYLDGTGAFSTPASGGSGTVTTISVASTNGFAGTVATATTTPVITLSTSITGLLKGNGTAISAASAGTDYESPLTFSTGLTRSTNTITVNTSQNIATLSNLTSNGFVKTGSGTGALSVDTNTYLTTTGSGSGLSGIPTSVSNSDGTLTISPTTGSVVASIALAHANSWTAAQTGLFTGLGTSTTDAFVFSNTTTAAAGAQQVSPSWHLQGQGWKTAATAGSQSVDFQGYVLPIQGTNNPSGQFQLQAQVNGGGYTTVFTSSSGGAMSVLGAITGGTLSSSTLAFGSLATSNLVSYASNTGASQSTAMYQIASSTGVNFRTVLGGSTNTVVMTAGNNYANVIIAGAGADVATTGTQPLLANLAVKAIGTVTNGSAIPVTNTASLYVDGAGTGGTNNYAMWVAGAGTSRFDSLASSTSQLVTADSNGVLSPKTAPVVLATITGINAKNTGTTALYTVPSGKTAVITEAIVRVTAASSITIGLSADVGVVAADIYANTALTTLTTAGQVYSYTSIGVYKSSASTSVINFNINTAATGTSQTVQVDLIGYLE